MWLFVGLMIYGVYRDYIDERDEGRVNAEDDGVERQEETMCEITEQNSMEQEERIRTKELACSALREMGCQLVSEEGDRIIFEYQDTTFMMDVDDDCLFVNIIWPWCHSFSLYDIDEFARFRKVANIINANCGCTIFYVPNPESDEVAVHIKKHFILVPQIPQLDNYLRAILRGFFTIARTLNIEMEKVRLQESVK